ncbi:SRPBCC domain-containing protein [Croceibacterium sp. TMG7-5b_MA50]|uniref:SRPBCC domain-containing protein n=1 Tax=Croceibacterium sp. TMG7-5b_MA50 TaxID=3121290 RepID=UPI0032218AB8
MADSNELSVTRFIAAAAATVWDVLANRQAEWWCPVPWSVEITAQERRAGGRCAMVMRGPAGEEVPTEGVYLAWDEGRRIVSTDAFTGDWQPAGPFMTGIWEIEPEGTGTRYTARARHWTAEARDQHLAMGFEPGWNAVADQFKALCEGA